jgi:hypothetical protein
LEGVGWGGVGRGLPAVAEINTMDLFADIGENSIVDSIAILLLMALCTHDSSV